MLVRRTLPHRTLRVSWFLSGTVEHRDSVGSVQRIRPGGLHLMTAGCGIAHSEYSVGDTDLNGVQLWVALPDAVRDQAPHFEHHGDLPVVMAEGVAARLVMGALLGEESTAPTYSPLICAELGALHYIPRGRAALEITGNAEATVLLIGGVPFDEDLLMWWNFVGRSHDEIVQARADCAAGSARFGPVVNDNHAAMAAPGLPTVQLRPRPQRPERS